MWVYEQSEHDGERWNVGFFKPNACRMTVVSQYMNSKEAADRCSFLNGGLHPEDRNVLEHIHRELEFRNN